MFCFCFLNYLTVKLKLYFAKASDFRNNLKKIVKI